MKGLLWRWAKGYKGWTSKAAMDSLRKPFFILALVLIGLAILVELGSTLLVTPGTSGGTMSEDAVNNIKDLTSDLVNDVKVPSKGKKQPPGMGISYLALFDFLLLLTISLMGVGLLIGDRVYGRIQGITSLIVSFLVLLAVISRFSKALIELTTMVVLFTSVPFGTIVYLALFGSFDHRGSLVILMLLLFLKVGFAVCLSLAQQRFLKQIGLLLLIATSLLLTFVVLILHKLVPHFLVSITDAIGAIVIAIVAFGWAIVFLVFAIISIIKALRLGTAQQREA